MAEILPIKAWRYNKSLSENIESLTSPLFDVVSDKQRNKLYENEFNSIHLSVPKGENAALNAASILKKWKASGIISQDQLPGIYVYYQYFTLSGGHKELCRKGFICNIKAYDWNEKQIFRHENTIPKSVNDRIDLLEKTKLNVSPTHGLYTDVNHELEAYMDEAILNPVFVTEDYQGVKDVLAIIDEPVIVKYFIDLIADKKIILADGHHRYEGSLEYRKSCIKANKNHTGFEAYNYHMMYFTNTESDDLRVLPTHRLLHGLDNFNETQLLNALSEFFIVKELEDAFAVNEIMHYR